jgi:formate--tetrahydrofolate ligase
MVSDIEIAQQAKLQRIAELAQERLGIGAEHLEPYGHYKAKVHLDYLATLKDRPDGKLILVTAISPTPAGEGKTTTTVGLGDALNRVLPAQGKKAMICLREPSLGPVFGLKGGAAGGATVGLGDALNRVLPAQGKKAMICLREPSLGPVFGLKGGAAGGGHAQVVPMEDINLHFTGDFSAIALAHNLLSALIDNHLHHGNELGIDLRRVSWKRVVDMNDRALRSITVGLGGPANGYPRQDGFDIVVASEIMAIFCLAGSLADLKERIGNIVVATDRSGRPVHARDLKAQGAMAALLRDALAPNLVQTLERTPAFIHGGPFANIAHGCNSVLATRSALKLADYVVTEAGFGADLGAEKFIDIKCRKTGMRPSAVVLVATIRALKYHGGMAVEDVTREDLGALERGIVNLERHIDNVRERFGLPCVVALNHRTHDTPAEVELLLARVATRGTRAVLARHWAEGGAGAEDLAREVIRLAEQPSQMRFVYEDNASLWDKMQAIATQVYGASGIRAEARVRAQIDRLQADGYGHYPVCVAKTQYSFSTDPKLRGAPTGHVVDVREVRLAAGAQFVVMICGDVMTMPGLPKAPAAYAIDVDDDGRIRGLF